MGHRLEHPWSGLMARGVYRVRATVERTSGHAVVSKVNRGREQSRSLEKRHHPVDSSSQQRQQNADVQTVTNQHQLSFGVLINGA